MTTLNLTFNSKSLVIAGIFALVLFASLKSHNDLSQAELQAREIASFSKGEAVYHPPYNSEEILRTLPLDVREKYHPISYLGRSEDYYSLYVCPDDHNKILVCHKPDGNIAGITLCLSDDGKEMQEHFEHEAKMRGRAETKENYSSGDYLGPCKE